MKNQKKLVQLCAVVSLSVASGIFLSSCKKEPIVPKPQEANSELSIKAESKSLPIGATMNSMFIQYLNVVGTGFQSSSTYFSKDFSGDGYADVLVRKTDGTLYLYTGSSTPNSPQQVYPDKLGDNCNGVEYNLSSGVLVGTGFDFVRYWAADFSGDGRCDLMGQNSDGRMWLYISTGTAFTGGVMQVRLGQAAPWSLTSTYVAVDVNGDQRYELLELGHLNKGSFQTTWTRSGTSSSWTSSALVTYTTKVFDPSAQFFPINIDGDSDVDIFMLKSDGTLHYSKANGAGLSFTTPTQCGTGWDSFADVYGSYHWNCFTANASLTGRHANGDFFTYKWNSSSNSFSPGIQVGTGWGFDVILTGNFIPDVSSRQDFLGINSDGRMHAYCVLAII